MGACSISPGRIERRRGRIAVVGYRSNGSFYVRDDFARFIRQTVRRKGQRIVGGLYTIVIIIGRVTNAVEEFALFRHARER